MPSRKLAAILSADVAGYSRLMGEDERGTLETLRTFRGLLGTSRTYGTFPSRSSSDTLAGFAKAGFPLEK